MHFSVRLKLVIAALLLLGYLGIYAAGARAGDAHDARLDAIAGAIAGHPVSVWCEVDDQAWASSEVTIGAAVDGYTYIGTPTVYLAPRVCNTLHLMLDNGYGAAGPAWGALAIKTIIHEDVHQRGISDEGVTDCTALAEFQVDATKYFGVPATRTDTLARYVWKSVRVGKKVVRVKTTQLYTKQVPNPDLLNLYQWAVAWHRALPANYQGGC